MNFNSFFKSYKKLQSYCEKENFIGWDPYDGLNSRFVKRFYLDKFFIFRLFWIQLFKRNPINLRKIFSIKKDYNSKGIALALSSYCNYYEYNNLKGINNSHNLKMILFLSDLLINLQIRGYSGSAWGYNFPWQARTGFLFDDKTPTVVATSYACDALVSAYEITKKKLYLETALSSSDFVANDLIRTSSKYGFIFSYAPIPGNNTVYNASLLAANILSIHEKYTQSGKYKKLAYDAVNTVICNQNYDGSWVYGEDSVQNWIDSFHTGYNIVAINSYMQNCNNFIFRNQLEKATSFYILNFFKKSGEPKYYHDKTYPIDIHCPGQLLVTLSKLDLLKDHKDLWNNVLKWTIENMQDKKGFFYFQKNKFYKNKIPYMRWSSLYMLHAMSYLLKHYYKYEL